MSELPIKIQSIVYTKNPDGLKILLLKRNQEDGGFWQTVMFNNDFTQWW